MTGPNLNYQDLKMIREDLKDVVVTKEEFVEFKSDLMTKVDQIIKIVSDTRQEQVLVEHRVSALEAASN